MARSDYRFFYPFRIRYSEIDGQSIVYNSHYLTFFDTASRAAGKTRQIRINRDCGLDDQLALFWQELGYVPIAA